jgi:hypothetical protein
MRQIESTPYDAFAVGDIDARPPRGASNVLLRYGDLTSGNAPYSQSPGSASRPPSPGGTQALDVSLEHYLVSLATTGAARNPIRFGVRTALGCERTHSAPSPSPSLPLLKQPRIVVSNCAPLDAGAVTSEVTCPTRPRHPQARIRSTTGAHLSPCPRAVSLTPLRGAPVSTALGSGPPNSLMLDPRRREERRCRRYLVGNLVQPWKRQRTVSVSVCNGATKD